MAGDRVRTKVAATVVAAATAAAIVCSTTWAARPGDAGDRQQVMLVPEPKPAVRPAKTAPAAPPGAARAIDPSQARVERQKRINAVRSWGYQLQALRLEEALASPYDLLVVDATKGHAAGRHFERGEVEQLKRKPDGSRRLVLSYLSVGEAEDYRPDYFTPEYMTEDAPDWLGHENPQWKGNRVINPCHAGWQATILGDENGRNVYNSIDPSPLYRLIELGFDGIYLDRVDVYREVTKQCPDSRRRMVDFIARLGAHARKRAPNFIVVLQNAEELVREPTMLHTIDAVAKEDLFYGADYSQNLNSAGMIEEAVGHLQAAKAAGRPVLVIDYVLSPARKADAKRRIEQQGFIPYIGPRDLGKLWLPGKDF